MPDRSVDELVALLTLSATPGIGDSRFAAVLRRFGSAEAALDASHEDLMSVDGMTPNSAAAVLEQSPSDDVLRRCDTILDLSVTVLCCIDTEYPSHLAVLPDAPALLFVKGNTGLLTVPGVAIVGTRRPSPYGKQITSGIARRLAEHGVTVISGMARGVDGIAHRTALKHGGATIAVLGCGVDVVYPPEAADLHSRIANEGAVVSEFPPGTPPDAPHFPRRNRIISGLSEAVIVTEAPLRSGSLITARIANEQNRDVYAVPGDITRDQSRGVNKLIAEGAQIVTSGNEIIVSLGLGAHMRTDTGESQLGLPVAIPNDLDAEDRAIVEILEIDPVHIDTVAMRLNRDSAGLLTSLTMLEMRGLVESHSGSRFSRAIMPH